ncbi:sensor histidine kinase [Desulfopila aestuarii]|uniref:histidine kinase n=1 Tax=Desulfopila aestuarii DSM 18488 TaxID=1121416 RepID=A0A1M7YJZ9_9BACT|nr:ATP-binding protein [Desulfopila aestuarii]SHO52933.1 His Kinase A (phospho-acceptor) domain-containing protein [Desulfopila aestuarii DSM 18488]
MSENDAQATITKLQAKLKAQQKTIDVLMDAAEQRSAQKTSPLELLSLNISLERVVQQKTEFLRKQREELNKALQDLKLTQARLLQAQKLESVGQLAAGIAHEINTPAQFIGSNISFLRDVFSDVMGLVDSLEHELLSITEGTSVAEVGRKVEILMEEGDWDYLKEEIPKALLQSNEGINRITAIVQAMKEFSHPGSKEKVLNDLNKIIETTVTIASNEWKYCAEIRLDLDPELPPVPCLADEVGQAILNILINACHAITEKNQGNGEKGLIAISSHRFPDHVKICIEDTGNGIPENIRERVFDPFFTTKGVGKGTGQGLAISHNVIEKKHKGVLSFVSEVGKGTTFTIQLPLNERE